MGMGLLGSVFLAAGCGKNPLSGAIEGSISVNVKVGRLTDIPASAPRGGFRAHHSVQNLEALILTVTKIELMKADGSSRPIWEGSRDVDVSQGAATFTGTIVPGEYAVVSLWCSAYPKAKGSVVVNGVTYYTKASHTDHATPPAELEEIKPETWGGGGTYKFGIVTSFNTPLHLNTTLAAAEINLLLDPSYVLTYYDGNPSTSGGTSPFTAGSSGMFITIIPAVVTVGQAAKKEVYHYRVLTNSSSSSWSSGTGRMVLLFDEADQLIAADARRLLSDNTGVSFELYGGFANQFDPNYGTSESGLPVTVDPRNFVKNPDGTYQVKMLKGKLGEPMSTTLFPNFQRQSHEGTFSYTHVNGDQTTTVTGTYACTRVE